MLTPIRGLLMILLASQWLVGLIVLPLFYHPAAGNPADNGSGGKPYNEIYQVHFTYFLLSIVLYNPGFFSGSMRRKRLCVPIPGSKGTWCLGWVVFERIIMSYYLRRIKWTIASRMMAPSSVTSMVGMVIASLIVPTLNMGLRK
jgi:hypothetical protein